MTKEDILKTVEDMERLKKEKEDKELEFYGKDWKEERRRREIDRQQRDYEKNLKQNRQ